MTDWRSRRSVALDGERLAWPQGGGRSLQKRPRYPSEWAPRNRQRLTWKTQALVRAMEGAWERSLFPPHRPRGRTSWRRSEALGNLRESGIRRLAPPCRGHHRPSNGSPRFVFVIVCCIVQRRHSPGRRTLRLNMARKSLWDVVDDIVGGGGAPLVTVPAAAEIIHRRPRGRPRVNPPGDRFAGWPLRTAKGNPRRCRNFGCSRLLRKNQVDLCCSEYCRGDLRDFCESVLAVLNGTMPATDFPFYRWCRRSATRIC
jgi:hypothetical protein